MKRHPMQVKNDEIKRLQAEIEVLRDQKIVHQFANAMLENIGIILAHKPFSEWPELAKIAYRHAERKQEVAAFIYRKYCAKEK